MLFDLEKNTVPQPWQAIAQRFCALAVCETENERKSVKAITQGNLLSWGILWYMETVCYADFYWSVRGLLHFFVSKD